VVVAVAAVVHQHSVIAVVEGNTYNLVVGSGGVGADDANGTDGGSSWFISPALCLLTEGKEV
jgi:hypothetical protein